MKTVLSILFIILIFEKANSQNYYQLGAKSNSLTGISTVLSEPWSVFGNQAGLSQQNSPETGIYYSHFFALKELALKAAFVTVPVQNNVFAISYYRFGGIHYNENKIGIAYARELSPDFSAGFQFNYFNIYLAENDKSPGTFAFEGGLQYKFNESLILGIHAFNPFQAGIKTETVKYKLPCIFKIGAGLHLSNQLMLYTEVENDLEHSTRIKTGLEYSVLNQLQFCAGIAGNPETIACGLSWKNNKFSTSFAYSYNHHLGSTPSVSISYSIQ